MSPVFSAVLLVLAVVAIGGMVSFWMLDFSKDTSDDISGKSKNELNCAYSDFFIKTVKLDCNNDCSSGKNHNLNITIKNNGRINVNVTTVYVVNSSGGLYGFDLGLSSSLVAGQTITASLNFSESCFGFNSSKSIDKIYVNSVNCPKARSSILGRDVEFSNC